MRRLEDQIRWYDDRAARNQRSFKRLKSLEILAAALIPSLALFSGVPRWVLGVLGGVVLIMETVLRLNRHHENWLVCRSTAEALKHERFLYVERAGPYAGITEPRILAERIEAILAPENTRYISHAS